MAQVITDGTMGAAVALPGPDFAITHDLGTQSGGNLFHSFDTFSIGTGQSATFSGPESVSNVISRVTGGSVSDIDGTLRSTIPGANVFLINPSGVVFGPNASLDVQGSFSASTANEVTFPDGGNFSATDPGASVLSVAPPEAFGFLTHDPASLMIDRSDLTLPGGADLTLVGGQIIIQGPGGEIADVDPFDDESRRTVRNKLTLPGGDLSLVAVASPGEVTFDPVIDAEGFSAYGGIKISDSFLDLSGDVGGGLLTRGSDVVIENSWIISTSFGDRDGADLTFRGDSLTFQADRRRLTGDDGRFFKTPTILLVEAGGPGRGGDLNFEGGTINFVNGVAAIADTFGEGAGGDVNITGQEVSVVNTANVGPETFSSGAGGDLIINVDRIFSDDDLDPRYTGLFTDALGSGPGGDIFVTADFIHLFNNGSIESFTEGDSTADAGDVLVVANTIFIDSDRMLREDFRSGLDIGSSVDHGDGNGGDVEIFADTITVRGVDSLIGTASFVSDGGRGGNITIKANRIDLLEGGALGVVTSGGGPGGNLQIDADQIRIFNQSTQIPSSITAFSAPCFICGNTIFDPAGDAGNITITARTLEIGPSGMIDTESLATGNSGNISINVDQLVARSDGTFISLNDLPKERDIRPDIAGLFSNVREISGGTVGDITVNANSVELTDGALMVSSTASPSGGGTVTINADRFIIGVNSRVDASTTGPGPGGDIVLNVRDGIQIGGERSGLFVESLSKGPAAGLAGSIFVNTPDLRVTRSASISTNSVVADGGNITIDAIELVYVSSSSITTSVGDGTGSGGNILIDPVFVVLNDALIQANAFGGPGGNVTIIADNFLTSPGTVITASSALSVDGTIIIDAPEVDLSGAVALLTEELLNAADRLASQCSARGGQARATFIGRGRSGLPAQPGDPIIAHYSEDVSGTTTAFLPGHLEVTCEI